MRPRRFSTSSPRSGSYERELDGAHRGAEPAAGRGGMSILVFLEHHGDELQKGSLGVLTKAATLGDPDVAAVLVGGGVRALASEPGKFGAAKVFVAEDDSLEPPLPQPRVDVLAKLVRDGGCGNVFFANSVLAADVAAGLAAAGASSSPPPGAPPPPPPRGAGRGSPGASTGPSRTSSTTTARSSASAPRCRPPCPSTAAGARSRASRSSVPAGSTRLKPPAS